VAARARLFSKSPYGEYLTSLLATGAR
jgi:hypothetical protein